jgi:two-component system, NarL family, sensor histidine kinase YdfH
MPISNEVPSNKPDRDYRVFYLLMTVVIAGVYVSTLMTDPSLHQPWRLAIYSIFLIIHIAIHWLLEKVTTTKWTIIYILVQGLLAFTVVLLSNSIQMIFGLFMPLMGETAGMLGLNRKSLLAIGYFTALAILNFFLITDTLEIGGWVLMVIPAAFFTILYTTMYVRQSVARERALTLLLELEKANRQLTEYAAQVEDLTIATERQRMARELHDTLSQGLAGLILQLEAVDAHLVGDRPARARTIVRETMEQARSTLADARRAIDDLRSTKTLGLEEMARREAQRFVAATGIPCEVEISILGVQSELVTEAATRAVAEALTNIVRHARAKNAKICIATEHNGLEIGIADDGIGFNPEGVEAGHYGLLGMRERVRLAGGSCEIHSGVGQGTQVLIRFPLGAITND